MGVDYYFNPPNRHEASEGVDDCGIEEEEKTCLCGGELKKMELLCTWNCQKCNTRYNSPAYNKL